MALESDSRQECHQGPVEVSRGHSEPRLQSEERENDGSSSSFRCLLNAGEWVSDVRAVNKPPKLFRCLCPEKVPIIKNL